MASIDKTSVRNEVGRLKADFELLCSEGKVTSEIKVLMNSMLLIIELMLSIFLERTTKKDSKNSSKPPSQTEKDESSLTHQGSNSKGKDENDTLASNTRVKQTVTLCEVRSCDVCGEEVLSSYWITGLLMDDRWFVFTSRLRFGHTSPLAIGQRLDRETVDNAPLSCGDVQGETDC